MKRLLDSAPLWDRIARELAAAPRALARKALQIAVLGALGAAAAAEFGAATFTTRTSVEFGFLTPPQGTLHPFLPTFAGVLATPLVLALALLALARFYRLDRRPLAALAVAVYGSLPVYATLLLMWVPAAILFVCAGLIVSLFWWSAGCRRLLGVADDESAQFVSMTLLVTIVATQMLGAVLSFVV